MKNTIIVSDFDGTITQKDSLYYFFKEYAKESWLEIERMWVEKKISSKECLKKQFELVDNLSAELVEEYLNKVKIDDYFKEFNQYRKSKGIDFVIVSDGVDYFINKILEKNELEDIKIISNHFELNNKKFNLTFPNASKSCINNSATCKCKAVEALRKKYDSIIYIGDGTSDFCLSQHLKENDTLFAKGSLYKFCKEKKISCVEFKNFRDILNTLNLSIGKDFKVY